jgi:MSHA pilin protein MshC
VAAILSAFALARINTKSFDAEGYANQVRAAVRYAQKIAISQRRNVTVTVNSTTGISLAYPAPTSAPVRMPPGTDPFIVGKPSDITIDGTLKDSSFTFSALGNPGGGGTIIVKGGDIADITITVEAQTGYVH